MNKARLIVVVLGVLLPFLARLPGGWAWLGQFTETGPGGIALICAFNATAWLSVFGLSFLYRHPASLLFPAVPCFAFLAWAYYMLDLRSDAQAAIALFFIPLVGVGLAALGGLFGYLFDRWNRPSQP